MDVYAWDAPTTLARCIGSALATDAPDVPREQLKDGMTWGDRKAGENMLEFRKRACELRPTKPDEGAIEVHAMFVETWGSTALGFGGVGGQAMTSAYTVVLCVDGSHFLVYWGGRHAYTIHARAEGFNLEAFQQDLGQRRTCAIGEQYGRYFRKRGKS